MLTPLPAPVLTGLARQLEGAGLEGVFAPQVYGPPWIPLAAAAAATERLQLASGIALAFVRSPFETAMAAIDLDRLSGGRFVLGLGTSVRAWSEGLFGMPYGRPLAHMRETVAAIRRIIAEAHTGTLTAITGTYWSADFAELQPPAAPVRTDVPIWIAALRSPLTQLAAEIADGVIGHPMWSIRWATEQLPRDLAAGLARAGRRRADVHVNLWFWAAPSHDPRAAVEDARATVAFYAGIAQYESFFAAHGFAEEARRLQAHVRRGDYRAGAREVPDAMVRTFVLCGTPDEVRRALEPAWAVADSVCLAPPAYALGADRLMAYGAAIGETFYGG